MPKRAPAIPAKLPAITKAASSYLRTLRPIEAARSIFAQCQFDEAACELGLKRLRHYRKEWDEERGVWKDRPRHDDASHGADAFLTFASAGFTPPKPHLAPRRDMSWVV